jgi:hypothetical protein
MKEDKKESKKEDKKESKKEDKKESKKEDKKESKAKNESKSNKEDKQKSELTFNKFDYNRASVSIDDDDSEFWKLSQVKMGGIVYRLHKPTGIILEKTENVLVGIYKDQKIVSDEDLPKFVLDFCINSDIKLQLESDETEAEMDAEDELDE